jgi:hypothetical protein
VTSYSYFDKEDYVFEYTNKFLIVNFGIANFLALISIIVILVILPKKDKMESDFSKLAEDCFNSTSSYSDYCEKGPLTLSLVSSESCSAFNLSVFYTVYMNSSNYTPSQIKDNVCNDYSSITNAANSFYYLFYFIFYF